MVLRSQQKLIAGPIEGYKIFNDDLTCRDFQFQVGRNVLPNNEPLGLCENGFHFCPQPSGVWAYYNSGRVFKIRAYDVLDVPIEPGADFKMVCAEVELVEEVKIDGNSNTGDGNTGNWNTGNSNTGNWNTGDGNTGDGNTGDGNTGDGNTGHGNTGHRNTGHRNTGNSNTGDGNTGHRNTGHRNTGHRNTGDGNCGNFHSGSLNHGTAPLYMFNKLVKIPRESIDWYLVGRLSDLLKKDDAIDPTSFLSLPNASKKAIKALHKAHMEARK